MIFSLFLRLFKTFEIFNGNLKYLLKILGFHGIFSEFSENSRDFLSLGIFIPGIRDFSYFRDFREIPGLLEKLHDFYHRDSGFLGFFTFQISRRFFIPGIGNSFVGWGILTKSQLWP